MTKRDDFKSLFPLQVMLSNENGDVLLMEPFMVDVFINDNDNANGLLSLRSPDLMTSPEEQVNEDTETSVTFRVRRTAGSFGIVGVDWEVTRMDSSTEDAEQDLTPVKGTVIFADGEREKEVIVGIVGDSLPEPAEKFIFQLLPDTATGGATVTGITNGTLIIEDSDNVYGEVQFDVDNLQMLLMVSTVKCQSQQKSSAFLDRFWL